jgi:hypothetical protein
LARRSARAATVIDRATTSDPHALATGIERVWVNGQPVFASGAATGRRPGRCCAGRDRNDGWRHGSRECQKFCV